MRAFLAIQLPTEVKARLKAAQAGIERGAAGFYRWTPEDQMHLTLYFLGEMDEAAIKATQSAASGLRAHKFEISVRGLALLPDKNSPRIISAGICGDVSALRQFQQKLSDTVFPLAEFKETRGFSPHVTLGRLKRGMPGNAKALKKTLAEATLAESPAFKVTEYDLVRSRLDAIGPKYETVHRFAVS